AIKANGGRVLVQDPTDAVFDMLPRAALLAVAADQVLPADQLGPELARLAAEPVELAELKTGELAMATDQDDEDDARVVADDKAALERGGRTDEPSVFTCPDCGGVLWELRDGPALRFRCHVGHTYTPDGLRSEQQEV